MLLTPLEIYNFGGFLCGVSLSIWYFVCLTRHRLRSPWSFSLGTGWLLVALGTASFTHSQYTPPKSRSWQDDWAGLLEIGPFFLWLSLLLYLTARKRQKMVASNQAPHPVQPSEGIWPPPPNDEP